MMQGFEKRTLAQLTDQDPLFHVQLYCMPTRFLDQMYNVRISGGKSEQMLDVR